MSSGNCLVSGFSLFRQSQEGQKEMKIMLDVYKGASKDSREKLEVFVSIYTWCSVVHVYGVVYGDGMGWYGMVLCGVLWCWELVLCGMVWYGMVWYGMVWYGMVWYGMVWYGMV